MPASGDQVRYERVGDDLPLLMARLRERHGVRSVLCEGGPTLNAHLLAAGLVDELFLTAGPARWGARDALTIVAGRALVDPAGSSRSVAERDGDLFTRWRVAALKRRRAAETLARCPEAGRFAITRRSHGFRTHGTRAPARPPRRAAPPTSRRGVRDVSKVYDGGSVGLDGATMSIGRGEFVFLVGPTGCGKSTCIRLLLKELEPTAGEISIAGRELGAMPRKQGALPAPQHRRGLPGLQALPNRTVYDNVAYSLQVIGESRQEIRRKVPDILRLVGLSTKLHNYPDQLSGGEQQRVSIARAFVNHPPLLLCDEPTGNLDPETSIGIMQLIYRINLTGTTVVIATHDKEMVDKMRRRVVELRDGRIVRDELSGLYRPDESTTEFAVRLRGELGVGDEGHPN